MNRLRRHRLLVGVVLLVLLAWPAVQTAQAVPAADAAPVTGSDTSSNTTDSSHPGAVGGRGWKWSAPKQVSTADPAQFVALSCGTPTSCLAADQGGFYYRWDGRKWSLSNRYGFPTDGFYESYRVSSLSCTSANFCASVEMYSSDIAPPRGSVVFWEGNQRHRQTIPDGWGATEVSCTSPSNCVAVPDDLSPGWARWDGTSWQVHDPSFVDARGLTCATATLCLARNAFDSSVLRFTGSSWVAEDALPPSTVSCVSASLCLAIGSDAVTRRFTGSTWVVAPTPPVGGSLSCAHWNYCVDFGLSTYSVYNGRRWSVPAALPTAPVEGLLSCVRASFCAVAGGNQLAQYQRRNWSRTTTVGDDPAPLTHVSCATPRSCIGVDTYDAHRFTRAGQVDRTELGLAMEPPSTITGVSCVTTRFCVATTSQYLPSSVLHVFDGSGWQDAGSNDTVRDLRAVSCATTRFCAAVGFDLENGGGTTSIFDGTSWRSFSSPVLTRVSCVSATFCLGTSALDGRSVASVFNGTAWSTPTAFGDATAAPVSVSCASTRLCIAVDPDGRAATYRPARWSAFAAVPGAGPLVAVSCRGPATCLAVSSTGRVVRHLGALWSRARHLNGLTTPTDISCPSARACVVVDNTGQAVFGRT